MDKTKVPNRNKQLGTNSLRFSLDGHLFLAGHAKQIFLRVMLLTMYKFLQPTYP